LLVSIGFRVREAENGEVAIRCWQEWRPELILMDIHMPVMNGLEAVRRIRAAGDSPQPVVVALTASAMDDDRRSVAESGADSFLAKPCREDELLEKIRSLLSLDYEYQEGSDAAEHDRSAPSTEKLAHLPRELVEEMREATLAGNKRLIDKLTAQVRTAGDHETARALQELADRYEYDALSQLLDAVCSR
jgi:CheY-like chemotaxis protein